MLLILAALFCASITTYADALRCASCTNITDVQDCNSYTTCNLGEECLSSSATSIIGRSISPIECLQCCAVDDCNEKLCSAGTQVTNEVGHCADDPKFDCQQFSTVFSICSDIVHAKSVCRKWCGLCGLVDGAWSPWTNWSNCDVTCGNGHVTRSRTCTDPSPAHGGLPCSGNSSEINTCSLEHCPVHGGWSEWKPWSPCSNSCGIGTMSRHRTCNNPTPDLTGNHCFGESVDFKACFEQSCADGGWSLWSGWSTCVKGLRSKTRSCDNPAPSQFGHDCVGGNTDKDRCPAVAFTVNTPNGTVISSTLIFTNIVTNVGGGYNPNTGRFTCTSPGLYLFVLSLESVGKHDVYCCIRKNESFLTLARSYTSNEYTTASASIILSLSTGDVVDVGGCVGTRYLYSGVTTSFIGTAIN